jgi:hypothetical protein
MSRASVVLKFLSRRLIVSAVSTVTVVGTAWAGVGLMPVSTEQAPAAPAEQAVAPEPASAVAAAAAESVQSADAASPPDLSGLQRLPDGEFLVGASEVSLAPDPEQWQTEDCAVYGSNVDDSVTHLSSRILQDNTLPGWPKSEHCVYLGGYGLGPSRPATEVDPTLDYRAQTLAISNGEQTLVWQMTPFVGFFNRYRDDICDRCGILDIRREVADGLGVAVDNIAIGSNHSHGGADGYGAWGGMPTWYREQVRDALVASAYEAVAAMEPALIEVGSVDARSFSNERRSTYHSVQDLGAAWLQARTLPGGNQGGAAPEVIATLVNFAAHPTVLGSGNLRLHGDWPSAASEALKTSFGGVGLVFEGGLGNVTPARPRNPETDLNGDGAIDSYDNVLQMGNDFVAYVGRDIARGGTRLRSNVIAAVDTTITHPITNWTETALGITNLLDREFMPGTDGADGPSAYQWNKGGTGSARPCVSSGPVSVRTQLTGYRVGELSVVTAPGEIFSGISVIAKAKIRNAAFDGGQTMVFGQTQDSLGYIIQSYEQYPYQGVSAGTGGIEYEETFLLDRCVGDHVLDTMLTLGRAIWEQQR